MPKDRRVRSAYCLRSRKSPIPLCSKDARQEKSKTIGGRDVDVKEWEEVRCPICMEHPHSAVLLRCSSYEKGCRPYICNTSDRHSNCLSKFCGYSGSSVESRSQSKLVCPLCRGQVSDWVVVEPARQFLNSKARNCSHEACDFSGTYVQLRNHTRQEHPNSRPSEVDAARQQEWIRLERETEVNDIISVHLSNLQYIGGESMSPLSTERLRVILRWMLLRPEALTGERSFMMNLYPEMFIQSGDQIAVSPGT
ncbi:late embryoproteinsis abundant protein 2-like [Fagus crenata]|jgi:hypothetical protein|uniref:Uncharacterized protein n=1 Tax=Fagus sylvatica TaxID=28930 RepID=A0A2N9I3W6_FAGSY